MSEAVERLLLAAEWTNDCQGKKDYDGDILSISTRYWPAGGGFWVVSRSPDSVTIDERGDPEIKPSATSVLVLWHGDPEDRHGVDLAEREFEGASFKEVATQVEAWAQEQMDRAIAALRREFGEHAE